MSKALLVLFLLMFTAVGHVNLEKNTHISNGSWQVFKLKGDNKVLNSVQSDLVEMELKGKSVELVISYSEIYNYIKSLKLEYGGIKPSLDSLDAYANSTFWAFLALKLIGKMEKYKAQNKDIKSFLAYLYNEEIGGFRNSLEGPVSLTATGYALLIMNISGTSFNEYNKSRTLSFIQSELNKTETRSDLISVIMAGISLILLGNKTLALNLKTDIMNFYTNGLFYDPDYPSSRILSTYLAVTFLKMLGEKMNSISNEIINAILAFKIQLENDTLAFGENNSPSVFQTGLATSILAEMGYNFSNIKENLTKFLASTYSEGGFKENLNASKPDVFSTSGAILTMLSLGRMYEDFKFTINLETGEQIPKGLNHTTLKIQVKLEKESINWLSFYSNVSNSNAIYNSSEGGYILLLNLTNFDYGRYIAKIEYWPTIPYIANVSNFKVKEFRIGYDINVKLNATDLNPGQTVQANVTITYYNGSYVKNSTLLYKVIYGDLTVQEGSQSLNGSFVLINITLQKNASLGSYIAMFYVNDSNGFNHTFIKTSFNVDDIIRILHISGNKTAYHLGEVISVNASLILNSTGEYLTGVDITPVLKGWANETKGNLTWVNLTTFNVEIAMPPSLPEVENAQIILAINWSKDFQKNITLLEFNFNTSSLDVNLLRGGIVYIGETSNIEVNIFSNITNVSLENAKVMGVIKNANDTLQRLYFYFNEKEKTYMSNDTINPNIPEGSYELILSIAVEWGKENINLHLNQQIQVKGSPKIDENTLTITPTKPIVGDTVQVVFKVKSVVDSEERTYLTKLILKVNLTRLKDNTTETLAINEINGEYIVAFKPRNPGEYRLVIYRESDNLVLKELTINVKRKTPTLLEILEPYLIGLLWFSSIALIGIYMFARRYIGKRISKRYLIRKTKKKK